MLMTCSPPRRVAVNLVADYQAKRRLDEISKYSARHHTTEKNLNQTFCVCVEQRVRDC